MKTILVILLAVCLVSGLSTAEPLNKNHISADAKWIFHVDFEAFRATQLGRLVQDDIRQNWQPKIDALNQLFGSDLTRDITAMTLFGSKAGEENASLLIYGKFNKEKLTALLTLNGSYKKSDYNGSALHHWVDDRDQKNRVGAFAQDNLIVISRTESNVTSVLDILSGKASSLAQQQANPIVPLTEVPQAAFVLAAAVGLDELSQDDKNAAILQNSKLMAFVGSEDQDSVITRLRLETKDTQAAEQIEMVLRGILAFTTLRQKDNPDIAALIGACKITRDQSMLNVQFQYPSQALMNILKGFAAKQSEAQTDPN
ncbi:MAG: hypothetical protein FJ263_00265 [Planctomycetes bacterium]|nr:hypothetical protein [Planctomycetota bacterium]